MRLLLNLGTIVVLMTLAAPSRGVAQEVDDQLAIPAIVTDNRGRLVTHLAPEHFFATVNGVETPVSALIAVDEPLHLAVIMLETDTRSIAALMDVSRSLGNRLSSTPLVVEGEGTVLERLEQAFGLLREEAGRRKAVLILGDSNESPDPAAIEATVAGEGFPVFVLSPGQELAEVVRQTGGLLVTMDRADRTAIALANFYVLILNAPDAPEYSALDVALAPPPGLPTTLEVRHREGYRRSSN